MLPCAHTGGQNRAGWQIHASSCSQRTGYSAFLGTFRPLREKASTNSGACLFALSAGALQSQTGRLGFHSQSNEGLVSSVMDRPNRLHVEIPLFIHRAGRENEHFLHHSDTHLLCAGGRRRRGELPSDQLCHFFHCHFP